MHHNTQQINNNLYIPVLSVYLRNVLEKCIQNYISCHQVTERRVSYLLKSLNDVEDLNVITALKCNKLLSVKALLH